MAGHIAKPIDPPLLFGTLAKVTRAVSEEAASGTNAPAVPATTDLPSVAGLDCADGLRRVGGNNKLYVRLLRQFAAQQADAVAQIRAALAKNDIESAIRFAHTLKGVAGSLGAGPVQAAAGDVEQLLRDGSLADVLDTALAKVAVVLDPLVAQLRATLAIDAITSEAAPAVAPAQTRAIAAQLAKLFADFDTSALSFTEQNGASLRPAFDAATWDQFLRRTQEFAFADAQTLLDQALANLSAS
jgi:two-component system sensor histidine kinase/response regulator